METNPGLFNDASDHTRLFWGLYAVSPLLGVPQGHVDLYYLGLDRQQARFDQSRSHEIRHSSGTRLWGKPQSWDYNFEFVYQWGDFGRGAIQAWTAASDTGYTLQTFNARFPKGAYFGEIALIGPANFIDLHPFVDFHLTPHLIVTTDWDIFWRQSIHDGLYEPAINLIRSGRTSRARHIGSQATMQIEWQVSRHVTLVGIFTHFFAGAFLQESGTGR